MWQPVILYAKIILPDLWLLQESFWIYKPGTSCFYIWQSVGVTSDDLKPEKWCEAEEATLEKSYHYRIMIG